MTLAACHPGYAARVRSRDLQRAARDLDTRPPPAFAVVSAVGVGAVVLAGFAACGAALGP